MLPVLLALGLALLALAEGSPARVVDPACAPAPAAARVAPSKAELEAGPVAAAVDSPERRPAVPEAFTRRTECRGSSAEAERPASLRFTGRATTEAGAPIVGRSVTVELVDARGLRIPRRGWTCSDTDEDGRFVAGGPLELGLRELHRVRLLAGAGRGVLPMLELEPASRDGLEWVARDKVPVRGVVAGLSSELHAHLHLLQSPLVIPSRNRAIRHGMRRNPRGPSVDAFGNFEVGADHQRSSLTFSWHRPGGAREKLLRVSLREPIARAGHGSVDLGVIDLSEHRATIEAAWRAAEAEAAGISGGAAGDGAAEGRRTGGDLRR